MRLATPRLSSHAAACLVLATAASSQTTFTPGSFLLPTQVNSITSGDLNSDGRKDLVITHLAFGAPIEIYLNRGGCFGILPFPDVMLFAATPRDVVIADYDNDGRDDLVVADPGAPALGVALYRRTAAGATFAAPVYLPTSTTCEAIQVLARDLNRDGLCDVAVLCDGLGTSNSEIELWRGTGAGAFAADPSFTLGAAPLRPFRFAAGCFDSGVQAANSLHDFAVSLDDDSVQVTRNGSTAIALAFGPALVLALPASSQPRGIAVADLDGNGFDDIATANFGTDTVSILRHLGWTIGFPATMGFAPPAPIAVLTGDGPAAITHGDLDCDGDQDLALVCRSSGGSMHCLWNQGGFSSTAAGQLKMADASIPVDIETTDMDSDAELDLITCCLSGPDYVMIFCNNHPPGRCCHIFRAGTADAFNAASPNPEYTCPRPALAAYRTGLGAPARQFDDPSLDRHLAHSFEGLPARIVSARLFAGVQVNGAGAANDGFHLGFDTLAINHFFHAEFVTSYVPGGTGTITIDLSDLPGGLNLLPYLNAAGLLDVYCQDDTDVDYLRLELETCCAGAAPTLSYDHSVLVRGQIAVFSITAASANVPAFILFGTQVGCTNLGPPLQNLCLLPTLAAVGLFTDAAGNVSLPVGVPLGYPPCVPIHTQAVAFDTAGNLLGSCTISDYLH